MPDRTCSVVGCETKLYARGFCRLHWERNHKWGNPLHVAVRHPIETRQGPCEVDGCDRMALARDLCEMHYARWRRTGATGPAGPQQVSWRKHGADTAETRFWSKVDKSPASGCWLWTAGCSHGYGEFRVGDRCQIAHRWAYERFVGPIPDTYHVDHRCHNADPACPGGLCSHKRCVNPSHLEAVPFVENARRARLRTNG